MGKIIKKFCNYCACLSSLSLGEDASGEQVCFLNIFIRRLGCRTLKCVHIYANLNLLFAVSVASKFLFILLLLCNELSAVISLMHTHLPITCDLNQAC